MKYLKKFEALTRKYNIEVILDNYIDTLIWTEEDMLLYDDDSEYRNEKITEITRDMISEEDMDEMRKEIEWFMELSGDAINYASDDMIGSDLWLTRNGHGAGFFDRDYPDHVLKIFDELSYILGTVYVYIGDNGELNYESSDKYKDIDIEKFKEERKFKKDVSDYNL